jgi:succinate dehydrogenase / fumarate reductase membrane anchor subunit
MKASSHWFSQRASAVVLCTLLPAIWWLVPFLKHTPYNDCLRTAKAPFPLIGITLLLIVTLYHARLGMHVIINDYSRGIKRRLFHFCVDSLLTAVVICLLFSIILLLKGI